MPGPYFNWRLLAEIPPDLAWYMVVNARRTGTIRQEFVDEAPELFLPDEPPRAFPAKLVGNLQSHSHLMSYRFSDDPTERETYQRMVAGDEAALSVARDFCRLTWMDAVSLLPVDRADIRSFTTLPRPPRKRGSDNARAGLLERQTAGRTLLQTLSGRPVRAGEIVSHEGQPHIVVQFMVRTRGGVQMTDIFAYQDVPFDPELMEVESLILIPARYVLTD